MEFPVNGITLVVAGALLLVFLVWKFSQPAYDRKLLPPGPPPSIVGKLPAHMWLYFEELSKQYGSVVTVWLGAQPFIIACDYKSAMDLMERKSMYTSDRPDAVLAGEILSGNLRTGVVKYGDKWRRLRKALHTNLTPGKAITYQPRQILASHQVLKDVLHEPANFKNHVRSYAATVIMSLGYSKKRKSTYEDDEIRQVVQCLNRFHAAAQPGHFAIDSHPWLRYWPGYLTQHKKWHQEELQLFRDQIDLVRQGMKNGGPDMEACFASYVLENQKSLQLDDDEAAYLAGSLFGAGSDTTVSALMVVLLAAGAFPEELALVQEEIDRVVGQERPPTFDDRQDLPRTTAFINESYRWRPVLPAGLAHGVTETFNWNGYVIPKGAIITGNHWSIHRDPAMFPDPERFNPSRWIVEGPDGQLSINKTLKHVQFGFGRRVCAGTEVAERSVFINSASLFWAFRITPAKDAQGQEIPLNLDPRAFDDAVTTHPKPFQLSFEPRHPSTAKVIENLEAFGS